LTWRIGQEPSDARPSDQTASSAPACANALSFGRFSGLARVPIAFTLQESAMQNPSSLSRAELVTALLEPLVAADDTLAVHVNDLDSPHFGTAAVSNHSQAALLARKLGVARELLLRDLRDRLSGGSGTHSRPFLHDLLRLHCVGIEHDALVVLLLDARHCILGDVETSRSMPDQASVDLRELVKAAVNRNATAAVCAHNHPPSEAGEQLRRRVKDALALVGVCLVGSFAIVADRVTRFDEPRLS
jgi:DNA repair protein RadC